MSMHHDHHLPSHDQAHGHLAAPSAGGPGNNDSIGKKSKRNSFMPFFRNNDSNKQSFQSMDNQHHHTSDSATSGGDDLIDSPSRDGNFGLHQVEHGDVHGSHAQQDSILELPEPGDRQQDWYQSQQPRQRQTDAEGFTVRADAEDEISRVQREAAGGNFDEDHAIRIQDQKIEEDEGAAQQAMAQMANTLRMQAQQSGLRNHGTIRGRRDARNAGHGASSSNVPPELPAHAHGRPNLTLNVHHNGSFMSPSSPDSIRVMQPHPHTPDQSQPSRPPRTMASLSSDSTSMYSTARHNKASIFVHSELPGAGLSASLVECVSSKFNEDKVVSSSVLGEIAFAYNPSSDARSDAKIRLDNHAILDKIAANPVFATPEQAAGEYKLNLTKLMRSTPQVVFKQSVRLDSQQLDAYCPVVFHPVWNLQDFQASVIINYRMNPSFVSAVPGEGITLTNVRLTVNLDTAPTKEGTPARAVSSITYPTEGARFNARKSAVTWKLPSLEVPAQEGEGRLLARFGCATPGPKAGHVDVTFDLVTELGARVTGRRLGISLFDEDGEKSEKDPFADEIGDDSSSESAWQGLPTRRVLKASKHVVD
ncbi:hypothetical protein KEM56_001359 [Ascosphaera pollenicola]|nr:hypothetical protein KEM56_001359 [Ascosphaera pollenicola]